MKSLQRMGGISALVDAATYIVSLGLLFTVLTPFAAQDLDFNQFMAFLTGNQALVFTWHVIMYMVNGAFLVVLALALYERLKDGSPALAKVATIFGLSWAVLVFASGLVANHSLGLIVDLYGKDPAQAATARLVLDAVETGINSSDRLLGGLWVLLISAAALRGGGLPKALNYLGAALGAAGLISSVVPPSDYLTPISVIFGFGIIVWWAWLGIAMLVGKGTPKA